MLHLWFWLRWAPGHRGCNEDALMREVVGFIQLACALTLGMAGGWAVHQMGLVMGWSGF